MARALNDSRLLHRRENAARSDLEWISIPASSTLSTVGRAHSACVNGTASALLLVSVNAGPRLAIPESTHPDRFESTPALKNAKSGARAWGELYPSRRWALNPCVRRSSRRSGKLRTLSMGAPFALCVRGGAADAGNFFLRLIYQGFDFSPRIAIVRKSGSVRAHPPSCHIAPGDSRFGDPAGHSFSNLTSPLRPNLAGTSARPPRRAVSGDQAMRR